MALFGISTRGSYSHSLRAARFHTEGTILDTVVAKMTTTPERFVLDMQRCEMNASKTTMIW